MRDSNARQSTHTAFDEEQRHGRLVGHREPEALDGALAARQLFVAREFGAAAARRQLVERALEDLRAYKMLL